jgi:hypothetical protein
VYSSNRFHADRAEKVCWGYLKERHYLSQISQISQIYAEKDNYHIVETMSFMLLAVCLRKSAREYVVLAIAFTLRVSD